MEEYKLAADMFESAGRVSFESNINKGAVHEYYYMALLLTFVSCARSSSQSIQPAQLLYRKFSAENRRYESTRQFKIINTCMRAFEDDDSKAFTAALFEYNKIKPLEDVEAKLFLTIKKILKMGLRNSQPAEAGEDMKEEDDYT
jgi:alpha-soluble NSF attachment protein